MNDMVLFGKALSDPARVRILWALGNRELCVCELSDALEMSQSTLSGHLQTLRQAGILAATRRHKWMDYRVEPNAAPVVEAILNHYAQGLRADARTRRDAERVEQRLVLRVDGFCVLGPGQLDR